MVSLEKAEAFFRIALWVNESDNHTKDIKAVKEKISSELGLVSPQSIDNNLRFMITKNFLFLGIGAVSTPQDIKEQYALFRKRNYPEVKE